jgi:hypothetical protein
MKGIIINANGFTNDAYKFAGEVGIDAFLLIDANSIKWNNIAVVQICIEKNLFGILLNKNFNHEKGEKIGLKYDNVEVLKIVIIINEII